MEGTPTSKRRYKLKKSRVSESKCNFKECTPGKAIPPRGHSTPVDSGTAPRISPTTVVIHKDINGDEDDDRHSPFQFHCTQDTLVVGWDCGSPQHRSRKKLGSKVKKNLSKGNSFAHKKQNLGSCSPIQPLRPRRRFNIETPAGDFTELIPQLQVVADLVKKVKDQDAATTHHSSCDEVCVKNGSKTDGTVNFTTKEGEGSTSNDAERVLAVDTPTSKQEVYVNGAQKMKGLYDTTCHAELNMSNGNQCDVGNETFTALFDDDADDFMLQCSQEIEENLNKNVPVACSDNKKLPLPGYKENFPISVQAKIRSPEIFKPVRSLKYHSNNIKKPNSPKVGTKYYVRIKSNTQRYSKDEHDQFHSSIYSPGATVQLHNGTNNLDSAVTSSKPPSASEITFDDSFDAVLQNLSEDDMKKLSQGHAVEKRHAGKIAGTGSGKHFVQKVEDRTEVNFRKGNVLTLAVGQSSSIHKPSVNNNRQLNYVNQVTARNETCAPRIRNVKFELKVPSAICNNRNLSERPSTMACVQLNKPHFNKDVPFVNNKVFIMRQGHSVSAVKKNSDSVCPGSSTTINTPTPNDVSKSSPHKCTPEEIQKKQQEAKKKLEKKRLAILCQNDKQYYHSEGS